ncbi:hypothetical protein D0Z07_7119 [Hyphodiscus hymeniophilus]|uniref:Inheritance of peroxisomes protein 1 n=1 Tax=Hyphodiscus hymeniophilus TaxID=353542 RepID=A0A9P6VG24_9HELO|nr:hypothetical protein D0Z07_7119 [Hyphodiscus hymeniophilus]
MAPSTPALPPAPRRSVSLPVQSRADPQTEVLYTLPFARIVQFQTSGSSTKRASSGSDSPLVEEEAGTLSWASRFERTIAVGPFRIYRAPGSVAFLNCQNALRPILPKSQCWVVDDDSSKIVLQIKPPQYWRIEVPNNTPEDRIRTEELKEVLGKVLLFEKTLCPFQRSFVVKLPETPTTPIKKKPWKPVEKATVEYGLPRSSSGNEQDVAPAYERRLSNPTMIMEELTEEVLLEAETSNDIPKSLAIVPKLEGREELSDFIEPSPAALLEVGAAETEEHGPLEEPLKSGSHSSPPPFLEPSILEKDSVFTDFSGLEEDDSYSDATDDTNITPRNLFQPSYQAATFESEKEDRVQQPLQYCSRSITAPPVLSLVTSPPSKHRAKSPLRNSTLVESDSDFSSSVDSFHSVQSWHSPLAPPSPPASGPPSPTSQYPYPHNNIVLPKRSAHHSRDVSELTATPETPRVWEINPSSQPNSAPRSRSHSPPPKTPTLIPSTENSDDEYEVLTPPSIRHRATTSSNSRRRELSPLPAAVNLFSPRRRRSQHLQTARHLPTAIVQKTCEILLSPPSHLLHLMLSIASKIAAGEWRGMLRGQGESVHWDFEDEYGGEGWEDDFGISLPATKSGVGKQTKGQKATNGPGGSWEID